MIPGKSKYLLSSSGTGFRKSKHHVTCCSNQRGAILVSLILTLTIIAILGAVMVQMTTTATLGELFANRQQRAYYLAEAGGRYAVPQILADPAQAEIDLHGKTFTLAGGDQFTFTLDNSTPDVTILDSAGMVQPGDWLESRVKITYRIPWPRKFSYGAFTGTQRLTVDDDAYLDSYDSSLGPWTSEGTSGNGHVGTNRTGKNSIDIKRRSKVYGNATVGPGGNLAKDIRVANTALLSGTRGTLTAGEDMTPKTMPAGGGAPVDLLLINNQTYTFTTGEYRLNLLEVGDNAVLTISGNVTLYVEDRIRFTDWGTLDILAGGSLTMYAADEFAAENTARINQNGKPGNFVIFGTAGFNKMNVKDDALMKGAIYAPGANAQMDRNAELFGSIIADKVTLKDSAKLHYDEALGRSGVAGGAIVQYF